MKKIYHSRSAKSKNVIINMIITGLFFFFIMFVFWNGEGAEVAGINEDLHSAASPYRYLSW